MQNKSAWLMMSDEDLVRLSQAGEGDAFSELAGRHYQASLRLAFSILRVREQAEDEVQNAYWNAFAHIGQFQREARFSTWMTRIVVNQCLMRLRQLKRLKTVFIDDVQQDDEQAAFELTDRGPTPEAQVQTGEVRALMEREIRRIPPLLRHAFVLREVEDLPMPEVARKLGISVAAAKSRLSRARAELRLRLKSRSLYLPGDLVT